LNGVLELFFPSIANCKKLKIQKIQKSTSPIVGYSHFGKLLFSMYSYILTKWLFPFSIHCVSHISWDNKHFFAILILENYCLVCTHTSWRSDYFPSQYVVSLIFSISSLDILAWGLIFLLILKKHFFGCKNKDQSR
jgi:hypothetical protein